MSAFVAVEAKPLPVAAKPLVVDAKLLPVEAKPLVVDSKSLAAFVAIL